MDDVQTSQQIIELPDDIERQLRAMSYRMKVSQNDIIVGFIRDGLDLCDRKGSVSYAAKLASLEATKKDLVS